MENKEELKTKDMEVLPEGWKRVRLGKVVLENPKSKLNVEDADNSGLFLFFTSGTEVLTHSKFLVDDENLFIADGGIANVKYYKGKAGYSNHVYCLQAKELGFFLYYIILHRIDEITNKFFTGTGLKNLNKPLFKREFLINIPPLSEQEKIAEILETVDNAIEKTDKIIEKYKRIKQGLIQDLLTKGIDENGQIRSEQTHKFKDSPLGRIPAEWKVVGLGEKMVSDLVTDGSHFSPGSLDDSEYMIATIENIRNGKIEVSSCKKISRKDYDYLTRNNCVPNTNDVLFTKDGTIGIVIKFSQKERIALLSSIAIIRTKDYILMPNFLAQYLKSNFIWIQLEVLSGGSALRRVVLRDIRSFKISLPPLPEQERIAEILSQIDETIEKEVQNKEKLERLKRGLMEDLLTGKVKVSHLIERMET
jgi:type I restriction enzyme S subunit